VRQLPRTRICANAIAPDHPVPLITFGRQSDRDVEREALARASIGGSDELERELAGWWVGKLSWRGALE
jgi:hypothetical protein